MACVGLQRGKKNHSAVDITFGFWADIFPTLFVLGNDEGLKSQLREGDFSLGGEK